MSKAKNWRTYYGYRPLALSNPTPSFEQTARRHAEYVAWLRETRGWDKTQADKYVAAMEPGRLISQHHYAGESRFIRKASRVNWAQRAREARQAIKSGNLAVALALLEAA